MMTVTPGHLYNLRSGMEANLGDLVEAARQKPFVLIGEEHATKAHQLEEASIIQALLDRGRHVGVGLEMFTRPIQDVLDEWTAKKLSEDEFVQKSDWKHQWGYDYGFYRPVLEAVKQNSLPLIALNIPRPWVHAVGTGGVGKLPTSAKLQLPPEIFLSNQKHRAVFDSMMGGHSMKDTSMDNMYSAQVLWDEGMADTALKYQALRPKDPNDVFVIIAGSGHVMYKQGINYRIHRRTNQSTLTLTMIQSGVSVKVSRGLGDFLYVSAPKSVELKVDAK